MGMLVRMLVMGGHGYSWVVCLWDAWSLGPILLLGPVWLLACPLTTLTLDLLLININININPCHAPADAVDGRLLFCWQVHMQSRNMGVLGAACGNCPCD